jgi:antitoxin PrlF
MVRIIPMLATLTSKGQVTLPKQIRDKLGLKAGSKLDFELLPDSTVKLRPANRTALSIMGMLKRPGQRPVSIEKMDEGITSFLARKHGRQRR